MAKQTKIIREACVALASHKLRTFLMMISIVIGIASLTAVICIGQGTKAEIMGRVGKHGNDMIMVRPGGTMQVFAPDKDRALVSLKPEDTATIEERLSNIRRIASVQNERNWDVSYKDKTVKQRIFGVEPEWANIRRSDGIHLGRALEEGDEQGAARVGVLGWITWKELFGDEDPVGATIRVGDNPFEVVGVFPELGAAAGKDDWDFRVVVPKSTSTKRLFGRPHLEQIVIQVQDAEKLHETAEQVRAVLRENHGLAPDAEDDFFVREPKHIADAALSTSKTLNNLLYATTGIALLIGGIVIMNIMLLSVSERAREIGLRRALGARRRDILGQFLTEALAVTLAGGVVGVACGVAASVLLAEHVKITGVSLAVSIVSCSAVALLFGLYPARKAAAVDPVVAMREAKM
ncbi:MAG: ABC transporter permease [Planctomycetes bacterium]|nr:ABC transporter permease [Planctomycetota bacterium]MBL7040549.1 ABC transporter permease [Pirellulaceae bacterium]